jgi:DNA-binding HxlR family transcriptional regulator
VTWYLDRVSHPPLGPFDPRCPTRQILDRIADKWTVLIVVALGPRAKRFGELRREIGGISQKMLTQTLRSLERDGLVRRHVKPTSPVSVEYELSELGSSLVPVLAGLTEWAVAAMPGIEEARDRYVGSGVES